MCWIVTAYAAPQTDHAVLLEFYRKVRPFGPGWAAIRREAGIVVDELLPGPVAEDVEVGRAPVEKA